MTDRIVKQIVDKLYGQDETRTRFRVWWIPQVPLRGRPPFFVETPDFKTARLIDTTLGRYDIYQYETNIKPDFANAGGIEYWDETEGMWVGIDESEYDEWEGK